MECREISSELREKMIFKIIIITEKPFTSKWKKEM